VPGQRGNTSLFAQAPAGIVAARKGDACTHATIILHLSRQDLPLRPLRDSEITLQRWGPSSLTFCRRSASSSGLQAPFLIESSLPVDEGMLFALTDAA
jgi:hypothetical protein